jgi:hypothetical protein
MRFLKAHDAHFATFELPAMTGRGLQSQQGSISKRQVARSRRPDTLEQDCAASSRESASVPHCIGRGIEAFRWFAWRYLSSPATKGAEILGVFLSRRGVIFGGSDPPEIPRGPTLQLATRSWRD